MKDRRQHPRVPYGAWVEDETTGGLNFFLAHNVSKGGILLQAKAQRPPLGHKVRLRLVIEYEKQVMSVEGEVIRHDGHNDKEFAVQFVHLDEERTSFLQDLVGELLRDHGSGA